MQTTLTNPNIEQQIKINQTNQRIIALGDSIVYGYGDYEGGGWVERLRRRWMYSPVNHVVYNLGIRGDRLHQVTKRLQNEYNHRGELRNKYPDLIMLSVGINDTPRLGRSTGRNITDFKQFQVEINNLLDLAIQLCPVIFVGMTPVNQNKMPFLKNFYFNHLDQYCYKEATKKACESRHIPYLDIFDLWMDRGENWLENHLSDDGLHPNVLGYKSLFDDVINWQPVKLIDSE